MAASTSTPSASASSPPPPTRLYVVHYPLTHPTFRIPVLRSVADQHGIPMRFYPLPRGDGDDQASSSSAPSSRRINPPQVLLDSYDDAYDPTTSDLGRAFAIVSLPSDEAARTLLAKCTSVRAISHLWAAGITPDDAQAALRDPSSRALYEQYTPAHYSWKADVVVVGHKLTYEEKRARIESCQFMGFAGPVKLTAPDFEWTWMEERWGVTGGEIIDDSRLDSAKVNTHRLTMVGRKITLPTDTPSVVARDWIDRLDLKKRSYIGNTSMEAEMSLALAEMAQSGPGKLVYDPFVGTGSLLIACAAMGSYVMGSDIDGRMIRGKKAREDPSLETGIVTAARQYGLRDKFLDCLTCDFTQHPWRGVGANDDECQHCNPSATSSRSPAFLDAIVGDPPYGVRAGAKRLGQRDTHKNSSTPIWLPERNGYAHEQEDYIPPTRPYALVDLLADLLVFAACLLRDGGRLVFWMPVMNEDSKTTDVPTGKEWDIVAVSTQDFGKWARRLVTLQRRPRAEVRCDKCQGSGGSGGSDGTTPTTTPPASQFHADSGRYRANVDERDFRNRYFGTREQ